MTTTNDYLPLPATVASHTTQLANLTSFRTTYNITATAANQTTWTVSGGYTVGQLDVALNGFILANGIDYTATDGSTIVLIRAPVIASVAVGSVMRVSALTVFSSANAVPSSGLAGNTGTTLIGFDSSTFDQFLLSKNERLVDSIAILKTINTAIYQKIRTTGYYAPGDGGASSFYYDSTDTTSADNGGTIIVGLNGSRWKRLDGRITPLHFGAKGDGTTNDTVAVNNFLTVIGGKAKAEFPGGYTFLLTPQTITIPANTEVSCHANTNFLATTTSTNINWMFNIGGSNIRWTGGVFTMPDTNSKCFYSAGPNNNLAIDKVTALGGTIILTVATGNAAYSSVVLGSNCPDNVSVTNCIAIGSAVGSGNTYAAIDFRYGRNFIATNNIIKNHYHGIQYWGGNGATTSSGALGNQRKIQHVTFSDNVVTNVTMGGIWGAMGQDITITGNSVDTCGDVGLDVEATFNATVSGNTVRDCINACLANIWICRNVLFIGNTCSITNASYVFYKTEYTGTGGPTDGNDSASVLDNVFYNEDTTAFAKAISQNGPIRDFVFKGNRCYNCTIGGNASQLYYRVEISDNEFLLERTNQTTLTATIIAISNFFYTMVDDGWCKINRNRIYFKYLTGSGATTMTGIQVTYNSYSAPLHLEINDNTIWMEGVANEIVVVDTSGDANISNHIRGEICRNNLRAGLIVRRDNGSQPMVLYLRDNQVNGLPFPSSVPTLQRWDLGQKIDLTTTSTTQEKAVCTTAGTASSNTWAASTAYSTVGGQVVNGSNVYSLVTAGTSASSGGPTGTGTNITDGTAVWNYVSPQVKWKYVTMA